MREHRTGRVAQKLSPLCCLIVALSVVSPTHAQFSLPAYYGSYPPASVAGQWSSSNVFYSGGYLAYASDGESNRIPDYSYAGYHYGEKELPDVPVIYTLGPSSGDQTSRLQSALDTIGARAPDTNGHRGALLLLPGTYEIWGTLRVRQSGVVLRGSGDGTNPLTDTILFGRGNTPHQRTVVIVGSNDGSPWSTGTQVNITNDFAQVGSLSVDVANASGFSVGQEVQIRHPSPQTWIDAVGGGGMVSDSDWTAGSKDLRWIRRIKRIDGTRLFLDAPIYNHLDLELCQSTVAPVTGRNLLTEAGLENLRIDIETLGGEDENHAWNAVGVVGADNCWVRNVSARYFGYGGVRTSGAIRITVKDCTATDPVAIRTGGRMYNFVTDSFSQLILFTGCHAAGARHSFISNGTTTVGGAVWHRCTMIGGDFEGHRHWSQAMLLDNSRELGGANSQAKLINRGDFGTSHGWGAAHSTIWKFNKEMTVQKPPTAQNYGVGTEGSLRNSVWFPGPFGSRELRSGTIVPESLYEAQLCDRLARRPVYLIARHSGKALAVNDASVHDGAGIGQVSTNGLGWNGEWFLVGIGGGFSRITARHSGKSMNVEGASTADGANVVQAVYLPSAPANDEWQLVPVTNGFYRIVNRVSGRVLGITGASTADGATVQQMTWTGGAHQQFRIETRPEIFSAAPSLGLSVSPEIKAITPGTALDFTVNVESTLGPTNGVLLAVGGLPPYTSASFNPPSVTNTAGSILSVATSVNTPVGSYPLTVTATAATAVAAVTATLIVSTNVEVRPEALVTRLTFDDGTANDSSGRGNHGALVNGATVVEDAERGKVLSLDGTDDFVDLGTDASLDLSDGGQATIAAWVNMAASQNHNSIVTKGEWRDAYSLLIKGDTTPADLLWTGNDTSVFSGEQVPLNVWTHVAVVIDGDLATFYVNGQISGAANQDRGNPIDNNPLDRVEIGREDRSDDGSLGRWYFNGQLDDVRIYETALSPSEILGVMVPVTAPIISMVSWDGADIRLHWTGGAPPYQVQMKTNLNHFAWEEVSGPITDKTLMITPDNRAGFYRVKGR